MRSTPVLESPKLAYAGRQGLEALPGDLDVDAQVVKVVAVERSAVLLDFELLGGGVEQLGQRGQAMGAAIEGTGQAVQVAEVAAPGRRFGRLAALPRCGCAAGFWEWRSGSAIPACSGA